MPSFALNVLLISLLLLLSACGSWQKESFYGPKSVQDQSQFQAGLKGIIENYTYDITPQELSYAALVNVSKLDQNLFVGMSSNKDKIWFVNRIGKNQLIKVPLSSSTHQWARFTQKAIKKVKHLSPTIDKLDKETIYTVIFDGYMSRLDEHSRYWTPMQARYLWEELLGFGGIGVHLQFEDEGIRIIKVLPRSAAAKAGLKENDLIVKINGLNFDSNNTQQEIVGKLRGPVGSKVKLHIKRKNIETSITLTRAEIIPPTVNGTLQNNILELQISGFSEHTAHDIVMAIIGAQKVLGEQISGMLLDMRDNPGGLLPAATLVSDLFLNAGIITQTKGRATNANRTFTAQKKALVQNVPIVVLVNGNSASASEIVAAALQDNYRALVVGSSTYGKGSVQSNIHLPNNGRMSITIAEFFAPNGLPLNNVGLTPGICTSGPAFSTSKKLALLKQGIITSPLRKAKIALLTHGTEKGATITRALCPPISTLREEDLKFARALLQHPALYGQALKAIKAANNIEK